MKRLEVRVSRALFESMIADLRRPHAFAYERVGFAYGRWEPDARAAGLALLGWYEPVSEEHYIEDPHVGVRINAGAIRTAMQHVMDREADGVCAFHVHLHDFLGRPHPSRVDSVEIPPMVESIARVSPDVPHGFLILSPDSAGAWVREPSATRLRAADVFVCGAPMIYTQGASNGIAK